MSLIPLLADSPLLTELLEALRKRSRAIKHKGVQVAIERVIEEADGEKRERLEIDCRLGKRQQARLFVWDDRALWVHAAEAIPKSGWKFQFTDSGRYVGTADARMLVSALEATWAAMYEMAPADIGRLASIWTPLLAKGPKLVA